MKKRVLNWKDYHHGVYQIYHGLIALTLVPFALLFLEWNSDSDTTSDNSGDWSSIVFFQLIWVVAYGSWYVWRGGKVKYHFEERMTLMDKLAEFKRKNLYKYSILAFCGILLALAMWVNPSFIFVVAYFGVLIQYSFLRPSENKIVRDMQLSKEHRKELHNT